MATVRLHSICFFEMEYFIYIFQVSFLSENNLQVVPGEPQNIVIQGSPHSNIGIVAVDQSVYLLRNDKHLTHDEVRKYLLHFITAWTEVKGQSSRSFRKWTKMILYSSLLLLGI